MTEEPHPLLALGFVNTGIRNDDTRVKHFFAIQLPGETESTTIAFDTNGLRWEHTGHVDLTKLGYLDMTIHADIMMAKLVTKS